MKLIGLMLARNEEWVINASLEAALRWCDGVALMLDRCEDPDAHALVLRNSHKPHIVSSAGANSVWNEMDVRQANLEDGRKLGGTHFAIIDADEILTHNRLPLVREEFACLDYGNTLEVPMIAVWNDLQHHRVDDPTWSNAWLTLGFKDAPYLSWKPAADGYHHHNRPPHGHTGRVKLGHHQFGGVFHLQWANQRRLLAKHVLYRMVDHLRWPGRESVEELNFKYDQSLKPRGRLIDVPAEWWGNYRTEDINLHDVPYQEQEIQKMFNVHGMRAFAGLDLKGFVPNER